MPLYNKGSLVLSNRNNSILLKLNRAYIEKYQGLIGARFWSEPELRLSFKLWNRNQQLGQSEHPSLHLPPQERMKFQPLLTFTSLPKIYTALDWVMCPSLLGGGQSHCSLFIAHQTVFNEEEIISQKIVGCFQKDAGWPNPTHFCPSHTILLQKKFY